MFTYFRLLPSSKFCYLPIDQMYAILINNSIHFYRYMDKKLSRKYKFNIYFRFLFDFHVFNL